MMAILYQITNKNVKILQQNEWLSLVTKHFQQALHQSLTSNQMNELKTQKRRFFRLHYLYHLHTY